MRAVVLHLVNKLVFRHALQSVTSPAFTQIRTSDDYGPSERDGQWRIGRSNLVAISLGLAPYKDPFFTSSRNETGGNTRGPEPFPQLQAAISTYSTGPVAFADGVEFVDKELIMKSVNADGAKTHSTHTSTHTHTLDAGPSNRPEVIGFIWGKLHPFCVPRYTLAYIYINTFIHSYICVPLDVCEYVFISVSVVNIHYIFVFMLAGCGFRRNIETRHWPGKFGDVLHLRGFWA